MQEILKKCLISGNQLKLPEGQLDRNTYLAIKKSVTSLGGKWVGGKTQAFVFDFDPTPLIQKLTSGNNETANIKKKLQFFPTPAVVAEDLLSWADISVSDSVLEPSAGQGALVTPIVERLPSIVVDVCELEEINRGILLSKLSNNINIVGEDFLATNFTKEYDWIIANPPFAKNQDIIHIQHMYSLLKKGGTLLSLSSPSWQIGSTKKAVAFRKWVEEVGAEVIELNRGCFKESGTNIAPLMLKITKL